MGAIKVVGDLPLIRRRSKEKTTDRKQDDNNRQKAHRQPSDEL
jgi:hypothetical protein